MMKLTVRLGKRSYDVIIKAGSLANVGKLVNLNRKCMVVTDEGVPTQYAQAVLAQAGEGFLVCVPQGEASKSMHGLETVLKALLDNNFTRQDCVIAVGGGVVGDLAGFAAASYMRGIDFINCPTTSLSQIDSSIGGKVAINFGGTKNIVGAFHQPKCVIVDTDTLCTLSHRHYVNGLVEAVKAGLIADGELFRIFEQEEIDEHLEEIICRSLQMKKNIVEQDETEQGLRAILNFGHTIGHAIEALHLDEWHHGECVALGMLPMIENDDIKARAKAVYARLGLRTIITDDAKALFDIMTHDKKAGKETITLVKVSRVGHATLVKATYPELQTLMQEAVHE